MDGVYALDNTLYNALITAGVSAIVTNFFLWWHKKTDYKRDYYKKIIDKRMNAYDHLQNYIMGLSVTTRILDYETSEISEDNKSIYDCFSGEAGIKKALKDNIEIAGYAPWFSYEIIDGLYKINRILSKARTILLYPTSENLKIYNFDETELDKNLLSVEIGLKVYYEMYENITMIKAAILRDITKLDNVEEFLKDKK